MYALCRRDGNAIHVSRKNKNKKKDVNTNLGMMLPGTLVRENTRIKKNTVLAYLYTQKGFVQDLAPPLRTRQSSSTLYFSHGAHKQKKMKEHDEDKGRIYRDTQHQ